MKTDFSSLKIALVYDRVNTPYGGAEIVLANLHKVFPNAPLFASIYEPKRANWARIFKVKTSFLNRFGWIKQFHRSLVGLMPLAFETLDLRAFDIIISVTSAEAKGVLTSPDQLHISYLLTPTRYLWSHTDEYQKNPFSGRIRQLIFSYLRWWDTVAAYRPDIIIPISERVKERVKKYYHRDSEPVIYPPVTTQFLDSTEKSDISSQITALTKSDYLLVVSRLVSYKKIDLVIQAAQKMGRNLVIVGTGPEQNTLQNIIDQTQKNSAITLIDRATTPELAHLYQHAVAFVAPGEDDFGIAPLEALFFGKPVILHQHSGAAELIKEGVSGIHLHETSVKSIMEAVRFVEAQPWDAREIQKSIAGHDAVQFQSQIKTAVEQAWKLFEKGLL